MNLVDIHRAALMIVICVLSWPCYLAVVVTLKIVNHYLSAPSPVVVVVVASAFYSDASSIHLCIYEASPSLHHGDDVQIVVVCAIVAIS